MGLSGTRLCSSRSPYYSVISRKIHLTRKNLPKMNFCSPLILIVVVAVISTGEAIKCHQCTSYTHSQCADPFINEETKMVNTNDFLKECPADGNEYTLCRKIYQNVRGD